MSSRSYWIGQVAGWTAYALVGVAISVAFWRATPRQVVTAVLGAGVGLLASHLIRATALRRRWFERPLGALLPRLALAVVAASLAAELVIWGLGLFVTRAYTLASSTPGVMLATTMNWTFTLMLWTAIYSGARFFRRGRDAEIQRLRLEVLARDAQLEALNTQIQPHFLFNALNVLRAMIPEDPARAADRVADLSELMRYALQSARRERVPLAEELAVVESYLAVEQARFEDRLRWTVEADPDVRTAPIPPMLLLTLVENAVKHGIAASEHGGTVAVRAEGAGDQVRLRVTNPGRLGRTGDTRIGLANSRERLRLLYGDRATLELAESGGTVSAEIRMPVAGAAAEPPPGPGPSRPSA